MICLLNDFIIHFFYLNSAFTIYFAIHQPSNGLTDRKSPLCYLIPITKFK